MNPRVVIWVILISVVVFVLVQAILLS